MKVALARASSATTRLESLQSDRDRPSRAGSLVADLRPGFSIRDQWKTGEDVLSEQRAGRARWWSRIRRRGVATDVTGEAGYDRWNWATKVMPAPAPDARGCPSGLRGLSLAALDEGGPSLSVSSGCVQVPGGSTSA